MSLLLRCPCSMLQWRGRSCMLMVVEAQVEMSSCQSNHRMTPFREVLTGTVIMTLDQISKAHVCRKKESKALGSTERADAKHHWSFFRAAIVVVSFCDCYFQFSLIAFSYLIYPVLTGAVCHRLRRQYPAANTDEFVCDEVVYSDAYLKNLVQPQLYKCTIVPS